MGFESGDRVATPYGVGTVRFVRYLPGDVPQAYSVALDVKVEASRNPPFPTYEGTVVSADKVTKENV